MRSFWIALAAGTMLAAVPASAAEEKGSEGASEKMICKRSADTGSLIKRRKTCMTATQWDKVASSQQEGARKLVEDLRTRPAGGP